MDIKQEIDRVLDAPSCYPEYERKSRELRERELYDWYEHYQEINICYNLYGMDTVVSAPVDEWLDRGLFRKQRHDVNGKYYPYGSKFPYDYTLLMRDKQAFEMFMRSVYGTRGVYCRSLAVIENRRLSRCAEDGARTEMPASEFARAHEGERLVIKNTFGFGGSDIAVVTVEDGQFRFRERLWAPEELIGTLCPLNSVWLVQPFIIQHEAMSRLNPTSVNTMRVVTYHTGERAVLANAVLRIGKQGSSVDNIDLGGCVAGLDADGVIDGYQFNKLDRSRTVCPHAGKQIPFFREAMELALNTHRHIPQLFTVGWDLVITPDGPLILEGNDGWDPHSIQVPPGHAQRRLWNTLLDERTRFFEALTQQ